jgi:hypothetical protein
MRVLHPITMVNRPFTAFTVTVDAFPQWYPPQYSTVRAMYGMYRLKGAYPLGIGGDLQYDDISVRNGGR